MENRILALSKTNVHHLRRKYCIDFRRFKGSFIKSAACAQQNVCQRKYQTHPSRPSDGIISPFIHVFRHLCAHRSRAETGDLERSMSRACVTRILRFTPSRTPFLNVRKSDEADATLLALNNLAYTLLLVRKIFVLVVRQKLLDIT